MTRLSRFLAAIVAAAFLTACSGASPAQDPSPTTNGGLVGTPVSVLDQARDVASDLEQRQADLESMIP